MRGCRAVILAASLALCGGCNEELGPVNSPSGFGGTIRFRNWPSPDSLHDMRIVAFVSYPADSANILSTLLAGGGAVYPAIGTKFPTMIDSLAYEFTTSNGTNLQVGSYAYVIVAQQYGPNVLADWRPVGVYAASAGSFAPAPLRVILHHVLEGIDIDVDFDNPPPKPWR
ncbi:MAG TPA: hypothetical protein VL221_07900 [Bacteroidota bacterium]|nr:hypothetical protein [Bacteroidota bacterium]